MAIKDQNNLTIVRAAAGKLIPENYVEISKPIDLSAESIISISAPKDLGSESEGSLSAPNTIPSESVGTVSAPNDLSTEAAGQLSAPNDLTSVPDLRVGGARILLSSISGVGVANVPLGGFEDDLLAYNFNTYEAATSGSGVTGNRKLDVVFSSSVTANSICISGHNLGSKSSPIVSIILYDGELGSFTNPRVIPFTMEDNPNDYPIFVDFGQEYTFDRIYMDIEKVDAVSLKIANVMVGTYVELPPIYGGHAPALLNRKTTYESNRTGTGNFVGRSIKKRGYSTSFSFQYIDPAFYRETIDPIIDQIEREPFVIQWRPDKYPAEAIYCWTTDDPQVSNMGGGHDLMQLSFNVEAYRGL